MSGIVGIVGFDSAPVDQDLLRRLTKSLRFRGPDADAVWIDGAIGFGHTLLRTTFESEYEKQPCSLDGETWVVADVRVDGRAELIRKLEARDRQVASNVTDPELILHAYAAWGRDCVTHLRGDFAFAVWDGKAKCLLCARDPFGVKPFYYAKTSCHFLFSNTLDCLRIHSGITDDLDERAIADFLLFGFNHDLTTTTFAQIRRLPGAHILTINGNDLQIERYWEAPTDGCIRYRRADDYVDHFRELFRTAVDDRLRTNHVGIMMSGGLDSTSIAATAKELLSDRGEPFDIKATTAVYDRLIPDDERRYAQLVADSLRIQLDVTVADDYALFEGWNQPACQRPEPVNEPQLKIFTDMLKSLSPGFRVVLTGWDGDALLNESPSMRFAGLLKKGKLVQWSTDFASYYRALGRRPPLGLRTALRRLWKRGASSSIDVPGWINRAFAARINANARVAEIRGKSPSKHSLRPSMHAALSLPQWAQIFEFYDAGTTGFPLEFRHPFVDLRLVNFLLSIPPVPFCMDKYLLRRSMQNLLPDDVRLRSKSPLAGDPVLQLLRNGQGAGLKTHRPLPALSRFVDTDGIFDHTGTMESGEAEAALRSISLDFWLRGIESTSEISKTEVSHEHA